MVDIAKSHIAISVHVNMQTLQLLAYELQEKLISTKWCRDTRQLTIALNKFVKTYKETLMEFRQ